jgi:hypothetical protein
MNWKYVAGGLAVFCLIAVIGCATMIDMYPAKISKDLAKYTGHDPNNLNWPVGTMGTLRDWLAEASLKHQLNQADIEYYAKKDNLTYEAVAKSGAAYLEIAQKETSSLFGQNGLLWPILALTLGGGGISAATALITSKINASTNYTPAEVKTIADESASTGKAPAVI